MTSTMIIYICETIKDLGFFLLMGYTALTVYEIRKHQKDKPAEPKEPPPPTEQSAFNKYLENFTNRELRRIEEYIKFKESQGKEDK